MRVSCSPKSQNIVDIVVKVLLYWFVLFCNFFLTFEKKRMRSKGGVFLVWWQLVVLRVQTLQSFLAVLGEVWSADRCDCSSEESWFPFFLRRLALCRLLPLLLLDLGLEVCR